MIEVCNHPVSPNCGRPSIGGFEGPRRGTYEHCYTHSHRIYQELWGSWVEAAGPAPHGDPNEGCGCGPCEKWRSKVTSAENIKRAEERRELFAVTCSVTTPLAERYKAARKLLSRK
jgi:hypothetical protein